MKYIFLSFLSTVLCAKAQVLPDSTITPNDSLRKIQLSEIVVTASRISESVLKSPVSIEMLDARQIRMSAQPSYFDAIENL